MAIQPLEPLPLKCNDFSPVSNTLAVTESWYQLRFAGCTYTIVFHINFEPLKNLVMTKSYSVMTHRFVRLNLDRAIIMLNSVISKPS